MNGTITSNHETLLKRLTDIEVKLKEDHGLPKQVEALEKVNDIANEKIKEAKTTSEVASNSSSPPFTPTLDSTPLEEMAASW